METENPKLEIQPWDRQPDESPDSFLAFCVFRDMGPGRTIRSAYFTLHPKQEKMSGTWFNWSTKNNWRERANAFDIFRAQERAEARREIESEEAYRLAENARIHRDTEVHLAEQAFQKAFEILSIPLVRDSYVEQRGGQTIIHKPTLLSPSHLFAATALMKAGSDIGRRGLGMKSEDDNDGITRDQFQRLFYRSTGEVAKDLPAGALPEMPDNPDEKPPIHPPPQHVAPGSHGANGANGDNGNGANGNAGNGANPLPAPGVPSTAIQHFKPPRDRP